MTTDQTANIMTALGQLQVGQARLEEKVDGLKSDGVDVGDKHRDHEQRLRRLERWMFVQTGFGAAVGAAVGTLAPRLLGQ